MTLPDERRRHDLANALTNVEVAAAMLVEEGLSAESRAALVRILGSGIDRLRTMLLGDGERPPGASHPHSGLDAAGGRDS